jgi:hypothetical protein
MPGYEVQVLVEMTGLDEIIIVECVQREVIHARTLPGCAGSGGS